MAKKDIYKYLIEAGLIVFSVLFALYINGWSDNQQTKRRVSQSLANITQEIKDNRWVVNQWYETHTAIEARIDSLLNGDLPELQAALEEKSFLAGPVLTGGRSIISVMMTSAAWETAKNTGLGSHFDLATMQQLTRVYAFQHIITDNTVVSITSFYFSKEAHQMDELPANLIQLLLLLNELISQEKTLMTMYDNILITLEATKDK